tara:strand:- start:458 stop:943 length:486 start_codon:yes stop_codon:yes gene_type:complete
MSKIKLLILLLISLTTLSCINNQEKKNIKLSISYIGGGYNGLMLSNQLQKHLNNFGMLDKNSKFQIQSTISHSSNLFITNIDNTSDRERISSSIELKIYDTDLECYTHFYNNDITQFYVLAAGDKFISNKSAVEKIKIENVDYFVKVFINNLKETDLICNE